MKKKNNTEKIVYTYNWRNLIMITRTESGVWESFWRWDNVIKRYNKNNNKHVIQGNNPGFIELSESFCVIRHYIYKYCAKSYGDVFIEPDIYRKPISGI